MITGVSSHSIHNTAVITPTNALKSWLYDERIMSGLTRSGCEIIGHSPYFPWSKTPLNQAISHSLEMIEKYPTINLWEVVAEVYDWLGHLHPNVPKEFDLRAISDLLPEGKDYAISDFGIWHSMKWGKIINSVKGTKFNHLAVQCHININTVDVALFRLRQVANRCESQNINWYLSEVSIWGNPDDNLFDAYLKLMDGVEQLGAKYFILWVISDQTKWRKPKEAQGNIAYCPKFVDYIINGRH